MITTIIKKIQTAKQSIIIKSSMKCCSRRYCFQTTEDLVRGASNFLVVTMYYMLAFKIHAFDTFLFEETPNISNSENWKSFLS